MPDPDPLTPFTAPGGVPNFPSKNEYHIESTGLGRGGSLNAPWESIENLEAKRVQNKGDSPIP
jgi:hypothetical protein